tara:strand:- start:344 stop:658 length:315 start_codon:yes stop_codon:yes gene_type:complete
MDNIINKIQAWFRNEDKEYEEVSPRKDYVLRKTRNIDDFFVEEKGRIYVPVPRFIDYKDEITVHEWEQAIYRVKHFKDLNEIFSIIGLDLSIDYLPDEQYHLRN